MDYRLTKDVLFNRASMGEIVTSAALGYLACHVVTIINPVQGAFAVGALCLASRIAYAVIRGGAGNSDSQAFIGNAIKAGVPIAFTIAPHILLHQRVVTWITFLSLLALKATCSSIYQAAISTRWDYLENMGAFPTNAIEEKIPNCSVINTIFSGAVVAYATAPAAIAYAISSIHARSTYSVLNSVTLMGGAISSIRPIEAAAFVVCINLVQQVAFTILKSKKMVAMHRLEPISQLISVAACALTPLSTLKSAACMGYLLISNSIYHEFETSYWQYTRTGI